MRIRKSGCAFFFTEKMNKKAQKHLYKRFTACYTKIRKFSENYFERNLL